MSKQEMKEGHKTRPDPTIKSRRTRRIFLRRLQFWNVAWTKR